MVGVSGGPDSLTLLHALHTLGHWRLHVATLDHGMRGPAGAADAAFVRQMAAAWNLPVTVGQADVPGLVHAAHLNPEETARQIRYAFLLRTARHVGASKIAVGHNRDDQAETVLMHLIRGGGVDGLRGMLPAVSLRDFSLPDTSPVNDDLSGPPAAPESWPVLVRPLLDVSRAEIETYAAEHHLAPCHDMTNENLAYLRNRLRYDVIPLLAQLNPNIRETLAHTADILREDAALIRQAGEKARQRVIRASYPDAVILDRAIWPTLSLAEKRYVLRTMVAHLRPVLRNIGFDHIEHAIMTADAGQTSAMATLPGGLVLHVHYDTFAITGVDLPPDIDAPALSPEMEAPVFRPAEQQVWHCGTWLFESGELEPGDDLATIHADPLAAALCVPAGAQLTLRTRHPGDRFLPRGSGGHSQKLSDTLINMRVPAAWRDRVPLLIVKDRLAWFVVPTAQGVRGRVAEPFAVSEQTPTADTVIVVVRWQKITG